LRDALAPRRPYSVLLPVGFAVPLALPQARCALTAPFHPCRGAPSLPPPLERGCSPRLRRGQGRGRRGGLFSVALSLGSPPPDVIRHRMSMEPGLSSPAPPCHPQGVGGPGRPSGRLTTQGMGGRGRRVKASEAAGPRQGVRNRGRPTVSPAAILFGFAEKAGVERARRPAVSGVRVAAWKSVLPILWQFSPAGW
jgi:hypothetical protein